jgi:AcrR family transcriptional regulator
VVADDALSDEALAVARTLAAGPTGAFGAAKRLLRTSFERDLESQLALETESLAAAAGSADSAEGIAAFLAKRAPGFGGHDRWSNRAMPAAADGRPAGGRREQILASAATLFSEQGYPATGIDEIGEAAGITGPGVYRHFDNKNGVLGEVVRRAVVKVVAGVAEVVDEGRTDWEVLEGLVRNMITSVLVDRTGWAVVVREQRHLDPAEQRGLARAHRLHLEEWVHALSGARPDLTDAEVRVIVHGVLGVAAPFAVRYDGGLDRARTEQLLQSAAMAVLRHTVPIRPGGS